METHQKNILIYRMKIYLKRKENKNLNFKWFRIGKRRTYSHSKWEICRFCCAFEWKINISFAWKLSIYSSAVQIKKKILWKHYYQWTHFRFWNFYAAFVLISSSSFSLKSRSNISEMADVSHVQICYGIPYIIFKIRNE